MVKNFRILDSWKLFKCFPGKPRLESSASGCEAVCSGCSDRYPNVGRHWQGVVVVFMGDVGALSVSSDPSGNSRAAGGGGVGAEVGAGTDAGSDGHVHEGAGSGCGGDGDDADVAAAG